MSSKFTRCRAHQATGNQILLRANKIANKCDSRRIDFGIEKIEYNQTSRVFYRPSVHRLQIPLRIDAKAGEQIIRNTLPPPLSLSHSLQIRILISEFSHSNTGPFVTVVVYLYTARGDTFYDTFEVEYITLLYQKLRILVLPFSNKSKATIESLLYKRISYFSATRLSLEDVSSSYSIKDPTNYWKLTKPKSYDIRLTIFRSGFMARLRSDVYVLVMMSNKDETSV